jgi:hypothetical protein
MDFVLMKVVLKDKKVGNPKGNHWEDDLSTGIQISDDGLNATIDKEERYLFAKEEFCLCVEECRKDNFSGIIVYYFEVTQKSPKSSSDW